MFEMTTGVKPPGDRKELLLKIGLFALALAGLGGVIYFFTFTGSPK